MYLSGIGSRFVPIWGPLVLYSSTLQYSTWYCRSKVVCHSVKLLYLYDDGEKIRGTR